MFNQEDDRYTVRLACCLVELVRSQQVQDPFFQGLGDGLFLCSALKQPRYQLQHINSVFTKDTITRYKFAAIIESLSEVAHTQITSYIPLCTSC